MTFLHSYLLSGLFLVGLPILIHLIMRQKPRRLSFPAFRFLRQQHLTNSRRLRLQHFLLLALRMLLIAALCLALAGPRLQTSGLPLNINVDQPVAAVLVFDTSLSMGLSDGKQTRLDEARTRARELLDEIADGSRFALLDSGDDAASGEGVDELTGNLGLIRTHLDELRFRPTNGALNRPVERAARLLQQLGTGEEVPPRFLYVFSDRTRASWENKAGQTKLPLEGVNVVYVDVGKDGARDLSIDDIRVDPAIVAPGEAIQIHVTVHASGGNFENDLTCQIEKDSDVGHVDKRQVHLEKGRSEEITFERNAPQPSDANGDTPYQVTVRLVNSDLMPFNDVRHATFIVRAKPKILTLADDPKAARFWAMAIRAKKTFDVVVKHPVEMQDKDLATARVVCLFQVIQPAPELWEKLDAFVSSGGGLLVVPGGEEMQQDAYVSSAAAKLLPGKFVEPVKIPADKPHIFWAPFEGQDSLTRPFREWSRTSNPDFAREELRPFVNFYWRVEPANFAVATYEDGKKSPALLIRAPKAGRIVQMTTPLDARVFPDERPWHNYWIDSSFGVVLVDRICSFLAGTSTAPEVNFLSGQPVQLTLTGQTSSPPLKLTGPEPYATEARVAAEGSQLTITGAGEPGNYQVCDSKDTVIAAFSIAERREESDLERVPVEELEMVLGKGTVLPPDHTANLHDLLQGHQAAPIDLLPWLMLLLLLAVTAEGLLANKFYRRTAGVEEEG